jgi:hypothetical protein
MMAVEVEVNATNSMYLMMMKKTMTMMLACCDVYD